MNGDFHNCAVGKCIIAANLGAVLIDQVKPFDAVVDTGAKQFIFHMSFVVLAMNAGLDSAIMDPTNRDMLGLVYATEALLGLDDYCMEYIGAYREGLIGPVKK